MTHKRSLFYQTLLACTLVALLFGVLGYPFNPAQARKKRPFRAPSGNSSSNGVRGECSAVDGETGLTALVNDSDPALTTQAHPTFLFYLPYSQTPDRAEDDRDYRVTTAEFELLDENEKSVLKDKKIILSLPDKSGIVKLTVPNTEASLEPDKEYFWVFRIICDPNDNTANPSVSGWIKRVSVGSRESLWLDRLDQLTQSPTSRLEQWRQLLVEVNPELQNLAQTPIVELEPEASGTRRQEDNGCYYNQLPTRTYGAQ